MRAPVESIESTDGELHFMRTDFGRDGLGALWFAEYLERHGVKLIGVEIREGEATSLRYPWLDL